MKNIFTRFCKTGLHDFLNLPVARAAFFLLALCLQSGIAHSEPSAAEKAGFVVTPAMRAAMNRGGAETPEAWLGNAIQYNYQTDPQNFEVGEKYRLTEARKRCAAGEVDSCAIARGIEKWLNWAKAASVHAVEACDRTPCSYIPDDLIPLALKGKLWVLHAWASWCPHCGLDHVRLSEMNAADSHVKLVSLVYQDTEAAAAKYLAAHGNPYNAGGIVVSREMLSSLDLHSVPATYVISPEGNILRRFKGTLGGKGQEALEKFFPK